MKHLSRYKMYETINGSLKVVLYNNMYVSSNVWDIKKELYYKNIDKLIEQTYYEASRLGYDINRAFVRKHLREGAKEFLDYDIAWLRDETIKDIPNKSATTRLAKKVIKDDFWKDYRELDLLATSTFSQQLGVVLDRIERTKKERKRVSDTKKKNTFFEYAFANRWNYFITLTYAEYEAELNYKDIELMKRRLNKKGIDISYLGVIEKHKSGGIHIHLLANVSKNLIGGEGTDITHYKSNNEWFAKEFWQQGFVRLDIITEASDKVVNYMSKYLTKSSIDNHRILKTRDLKKPEIIKGVNYCEMWELNNSEFEYIKHSKRAMVINVRSEKNKKEIKKLLTGEIVL